MELWSEPEPLGVGERLNSAVPEGIEGVHLLQMNEHEKCKIKYNENITDDIKYKT